MKPARTWIVIADGARARIVERLGKREEVHAISGSEVHVDHPKSSEIGDDRPGRVQESFGPARHAIEPRHDPHQELENLFAKQLVEILETASGDDQFDSLVIVAPPTMLGNIRKAMSQRVRKLVVAEFHKDLTKIPNHEVLKHLAGEKVI